MRLISWLAAIVVVCVSTNATAISVGVAEAGPAHRAVVWREDVDAAFREAKTTHRPVLLFWGAHWCPHCNRLRSGLYTLPAFIAETRSFVPLELDGDAPGAQAWAEKFGVSGYPNLLILTPDRKEIVRIAVDLPVARILGTMRIAARAHKGQSARLKQAEDEPDTLSADDWKLLEAHWWENDPRRFASADDLTKVLANLAAHDPSPAGARYFMLHCLANSVPGTDNHSAVISAGQRKQLVKALTAVLAHWQEVSLDREVLTNFVSSALPVLPKGKERLRLLVGYSKAMRRIVRTNSLPLADRLSAEIALVEATPHNKQGKLPPALVDDARRLVSSTAASARTPELRQSVEGTAADLLYEIGDVDAAKKLLESESVRSRWPFYYMSMLSQIAELQRKPKVAVDWARKAYRSSTGPSSHLQWAVTYATTVMRDIPADREAVQAGTNAVLESLPSAVSTLHQNDRKSYDIWHRAFVRWSKGHDHGRMLRAVQSRLSRNCGGDTFCRAAPGFKLASPK